MDDTLYGKRNKRGDWAPFKLIQYPPVFIWPVQPLRFLKWLFGYPGYLMPWNVLYAVIGTLLWLYATPSLETAKTFSIGWIAYLLIRNAAIVLVFFGAFHLRLYMQKKQGTSFKFNAKWPSVGNDAFLFGNQTVDNVIWTFASAVPIWTAFEVLTLWAFANGIIPYVSFAEHPVYCAVVMFFIPTFRDLHFYLVHRLIP